ncbi:MAG: hypothetical protein QOF25_2612 [Mycobacterium sp.]|jgi:MFS family permease|nr:hypothetical protein [Mycobacterium sp.]
MGLYFGFLGLTQFVQIDRATAGYGFSASVLHASVVYLLPGALAGFVTATLSGKFIDRFGARPILVCGALTGIVGFLWLALAHSQPWQVIVAGIWTNGYISLAYGALPALVVSEVDGGETGVATGVNAIARACLRDDLRRGRGHRRTGAGADRGFPWQATPSAVGRGGGRFPSHEPRMGLTGPCS